MLSGWVSLNMRTRRSIVKAGLIGGIFVSGCSETSSNTPTPTSSSTATPELPDPRSYLPEPNDEWTREQVRNIEVAPLGGEEGVRGIYTGPDDVEYHVIVFVSNRNSNYAPGTAQSFACAGWQISVSKDRVAVAASTGTEQRTFTPEAPPRMNRAPDPERVDEVRALLERSPRLTSEEVELFQVSCQ